jgi:hypothetical protein
LFRKSIFFNILASLVAGGWLPVYGKYWLFIACYEFIAGGSLPAYGKYRLVLHCLL